MFYDTFINIFVKLLIKLVNAIQLIRREYLLKTLS